MSLWVKKNVTVALLTTFGVALPYGVAWAMHGSVPIEPATSTFLVGIVTIMFVANSRVVEAWSKG